MEKEDILFARQPIYDAQKEIVAYELLFRGTSNNHATISCDDSATSSVLLSLFTDSDLEFVTGGIPAFVNFSSELLMGSPIFEPETVVIEILEHVEITPTFIDRIKELKKLGYTIALDDVIDPKAYASVLPYIDIVKVEILELSESQLQHIVDYLAPYNAKLLAEKVETSAEFRACLALGFDLFQGYFLATPEIIRGRKLNANQISVVKLVSELQDPLTDTQRISEIILQDPVISLKLLKLINSAAYRRIREIDSINTAVALLGLPRVSGWASLLAMGKIADKPESLRYIAVLRAVACEQLGKYVECSAQDQSELYTAGLLSSLDAFIDQPLDEVISNISLKESIRSAILSHKGLIGLILESTVLFERGLMSNIDWVALEKIGLTARNFNKIYYESSTLALAKID